MSHCGSDSEDSDTDMDALLAHVASTTKNNQTTVNPSDPSLLEETEKESQMEKEEEERDKEKEEEEKEQNSAREDKENMREFINANNGEIVEIKNDERVETEKEEKTLENKLEEPQFIIIVDDPSSEASDSCQTDSRFLTSMSSDSMDALEEDDLMTYFSARRPWHLPVTESYCKENTLSLSPGQLHSKNVSPSEMCSTDSNCESDVDQFYCFAALSNIAECLPSPPEASDEEDCEDPRTKKEKNKRGSTSKLPGSALPPPGDYVFSFEQGDTRHYYNICSSVTPDSARSLPRPLSDTGCREKQTDQKTEKANHMETVTIYHPPPGFGDSSSDDEFFDAHDRFTSPEDLASTAKTKGITHTKEIITYTEIISNKCYIK